MPLLQTSGKQTFLKALNYTLAFIFFTLSLAWLGIKLEVASKINAEISFSDYVDLIRSQVGLDLFLVFLFFLHAKSKITKSSSAVAVFLFLVSGFYFLKLTGLYAYTYDSTPWAMITYGSFLLQIPFSGEILSFFGYILVPVFLCIYLAYFIFNHSDKKNLLFIPPVLLLFSCIPPIQNKVPSSIAFHPYIYSISGAFFKTKQTFETGSDDTEAQVSRTPQKKMLSRNIVIIILESFSYSHLSQEVTPKLYSIKQQSLDFVHAYAPIPHTSKALINIHCPSGAYFSSYLWESIYKPSDACIPDYFEAKSVFFQGTTPSFENRKSLIKNLAYKDFYSSEDMNKEGFQAVNYFSYEDNIMLPKSEEWLKQHSNEPFIASYLTGTSHHNYQTPDSFKKKDYSDSPKFNRYLNALSYVDNFVGKLLKQYTQLGLYENSIFVFVGDHGEGFDTQKPLMHNNNIFESGIHIPLFIFDPQKTQHSVYKQLVSQNDIKDIIEFSSSLSSTLPTNKALVNSCWYMDYCYSFISMHKGQHYKYILDKRNKRSLLYNLATDPQEKNNLIENETVLTQALHQKLIKRLSEKFTQDELFYSKQDSAYKTKRELSFSKFEALEY